MQDKPGGDVISAFCDEGLALQFAELHEADLRFVSEWGRWYNWTGSVWKYDSTLLASTSRVACAATWPCWRRSGASASRVATP